ncbi:hypothetical protein ACVW19_001254 [Streptomyces sp. TE5632]
MVWTGKPVTALAVSVVLLAGTTGCGARAERGKNGESPSPVGRLLEEQDDEGRPCREVEEKDAPEVGVEVTPDADGGWDVRLTVRNFRFSPDGTARRAVPGRGLAHLYVNDRLVAQLRTPGHHLPAHTVRRGTHQVTARLYADDDSVWAVRGKPVESTVDITVSEPAPTATPARRQTVPPPCPPPWRRAAALSGGEVRRRGPDGRHEVRAPRDVALQRTRATAQCRPAHRSALRPPATRTRRGPAPRLPHRVETAGTLIHLALHTAPEGDEKVIAELREMLRACPARVLD